MEHNRQEFESPEEKLTADAHGLIGIAKTQSETLGVQVDPITFARRSDDDITALRSAIAKEQGKVNPVNTESAAPAVSAQQLAPESTKAPRQLTPEQKESTLATLAARFAANENLHEGVEWTRVKASLEARPEALWSINEMEKAGHEPDVYNADEKGFDIGTCSKESPESGGNCIYDEAEAEWLRKNCPNEKFNGSAVTMAEAMGIDLMDPDLYKNALQKKGKFDMQNWSWLKTQLSIRSTGFALNGDRSGDRVNVRQYNANSRYGFRSWRGSLRVEWAA